MPGGRHTHTRLERRFRGDFNMAWRIHEHVERGEIDNRECGRVRGRVWIRGRARPVVLDLRGNCCTDLAGCLLAFKNREAAAPLRGGNRFAANQVGTVGDLTASRKVRVAEITPQHFFRVCKKRVPPPEHLANSLFLEWFSEMNGRVVIESTAYDLTISPRLWTLSPDQERQRQQESSRAFSRFIAKLTEAIEATKAEPPEGKKWDEFDFERLLREGDARADKYMELLDKYKDDPDCERLLGEEMGWDIDEEFDEESPDWSAMPEFLGSEGSGCEKNGQGNPPDKNFDGFDEDEIGRTWADPLATPLEPDPRTEGVDWVRAENGQIRHPLCVRAMDSSAALRRKCERLSARRRQDDNLWRLTCEFQIIAAKLSGALNSLAYGRDAREASLVVACLKRVLAHVHTGQAALEQVNLKALLPPATIAFVRAELFAIREEILRLMGEFRGRDQEAS